ncbi:MAG TPA: hypothetical protein VIE88_18400, partial [Vicinamibacteria bacterium]
MRPSSWAFVCLLFSACGDSSREPSVVRLVDEFGTVQIENLGSPAASIVPTEWRFEDPAAVAAWK